MRTFAAGSRWPLWIIVPVLVAFRIGSSPATAAPLSPQSGSPDRQLYQFTNGQWFTGHEFHAETFYVVDGLLTQEKPEHVDKVIDLAGSFVVPPFGEAHNHNVEGWWNIDSVIQTYLNAGIFYVKNPNNIADFLTAFATRSTFPPV